MENTLLSSSSYLVLIFFYQFSLSQFAPRSHTVGIILELALCAYAIASYLYISSPTKCS
jgi:hypothetical protein